ncbi:MAG: ribonuclease III [Rickettsiales bacterium]|nr:ribonuclease III [Rickettsiales bacterium]|tara:strand:- start:474 stop:1094 length:621 start_codon:yes stop_codon:yes gene_type:complete
MLQALTHPSCAQKKDGLPFNNQRLEFLGDSVLGLLIAELLYTMYPDAPEGELARRFAALVCGETLVAVALSIGLDQALILSDSEEDNDGRHNPSNLEDACEAMIGALFLDGGYDMARQFVHRHWHELALKLNEPPKDPKTTLQEWAQKQGLPLPEYQVIETHGPSHAPVFTIEVTVEKRGSAQAQAKSKKAAERDAAAALLAQVGL